MYSSTESHLAEGKGIAEQVGFRSKLDLCPFLISSEDKFSNLKYVKGIPTDQ